MTTLSFLFTFRFCRKHLDAAHQCHQVWCELKFSFNSHGRPVLLVVDVDILCTCAHLGVSGQTRGVCWHCLDYLIPREVPSKKTGFGFRFFLKIKVSILSLVVFVTYSATPWTYSSSAYRVCKLTKITDLWVVILLDTHPSQLLKNIDSESCLVFFHSSIFTLNLLSFTLCFATIGHHWNFKNTHSDRPWHNFSHINLIKISCSATEHLYMTGNHIVTKHLHNKLIYCSTMWE